MIKINRGLDLPIAGAPEQVINDGIKARSVAVIGFDYIGLKPTMAVQVGDRVKTGQLIFTDKKTKGVAYTAPATGIVVAINRGDKRVFQSLVIEAEDDEYETFDHYPDLGKLERQNVVDNLVNSGQWTALRTRPYSRVPAPDSLPNALFVTAMDTHPLSADPAIVIAEHAQAFEDGLTVLSRLSDKLYVATAPGAEISTGSAAVIKEEFSGPHPAGLVGTHIHYLAPASANKIAWTIGYQDVIAIGKLFTTGKLFTDRVVSLAGPQVELPQLLRTRVGASIDELTAGKMKPDNNRVISGSVLGGRTANGVIAYLGRYHQQISVLKEGDQREFMG